MAVVVTAVKTARVGYSEGLQTGGYSWVLAPLRGSNVAVVARDASWGPNGVATWPLVQTNEQFSNNTIIAQFRTNKLIFSKIFSHSISDYWSIQMLH